MENHENLSIYTPEAFIPEKKYIINVLFQDFLGLEVKVFVHNEENYKIILDNNNEIIIEDHFFNKIDSNSYLENSFLPEAPKYCKNKYAPEQNLISIYGSDKLIEKDFQIILGIDIFASAFFMLTRWEELVIKERDKHNRFPDKENYALKHSFHYRPIVNEYVELLWNLLKKLGCKQQRKKQNYEAIITHDIDSIKRYDSFKKVIKAIGGDIILRKKPILAFKTIRDYIKIKTNKIKDPYDTIEYLMDVSEKYKLKSHFYFIPGFLGEEDVRYNIDNEYTSNIVAEIKKRRHIVGIHGAYRSYNIANEFAEELARLKDISFEITEGRQHYLRFENPTTWQIWEENGLKTDSTMGFSSDGGFRSGTCYDYPVFNILTREILELREFSLIAMDTALRQKYPDPELFYKKNIELSNVVKKYGGNFVFLWHNSNINVIEWTEYSAYYKQLIKKIS